jgi:hypothetical protein
MGVKCIHGSMDRGGCLLSQHKIEYFPTINKILIKTTQNATLKIVPKRFCEV